MAIASAWATFPPVAEPGAQGITPLLGPYAPPTTTDRSAFGRREPQVFAVDRGPEVLIPVHYHPVDQFQYFVRGGAGINRTATPSGTVQYADSFTPYGPIVAGPEGMAFLTLRAVSDCGVEYMPDTRAELRTGLQASSRNPAERRNLVFDLNREQADDTAWVVMHDDPDGLRIAARRLGPRQAIATPKIGGIGGYLLIVAGALEDGESLAEPGAVQWVEPGTTYDLPPAAEPSTVALLQFPIVA